MHLFWSNFTSQPALAKMRVLKSKALFRSGMMWPVRVTGRPSMMISHSCVDVTACPSTRDTCNGFVVGRLLRTGMPSITKICVAPVSAMASLVSSVTVAAKAQ